MKKILESLTGNHPLLTILVMGIFSGTVSGLGAYYWAHSSPEQESTSLVQKRTESDGENPGDVSSPDSEDTTPLTRHDWESFLDYEGERARMIGVKNQYNRVNVRSGPSMDNLVIETPRGGTLLQPLDQYDQWYRVRLPDGTIGWIHRSIVRQLDVPMPVVKEIREDLPPLKQSVKNTIPDRIRRKPHVEITGDAVNIRQGPGTQFSIVNRAYRYEQYRLLAREGNWYRVEFPNGTTAWIHHSLVEEGGMDKYDGRDQVRLVGGTLRRGPRFQFQEQTSEMEERVVSVIDREQEWFQVQTDNNEIGWVHQDEVEPIPEE